MRLARASIALALAAAVAALRCAPPPSPPVVAALPDAEAIDASVADASDESAIADATPVPADVVDTSREPKTLAAGLDRVETIALDESDAYVLARASSSWRLWRVPKRGGAATRVDDYHADSVAIAVDDASFYVGMGTRISEAIQGGAFRTSAYGRVVAASKTSGARATIFDGLRGAFFGIASDGTSVYWPSGVVDGTGALSYDAIMKGRASGGGAAFFAMKQNGVRSVAVDASGVFFTVTGRFDDKKRAWPPGAVLRAPPKGAPSTFATTGAEPRAIALDDTSVFWIEDKATLVRRAKSGGASAVVADDVDHFAVDAAAACWSSGGAIVYEPKTGEPTRRDAGAPVTAIAIDAAFVYFAVAGELRRVAR